MASVDNTNMSCGKWESTSTPYSENVDTYPYTGIMFGLKAKLPLEILTIAVDVITGPTVDMSIEVYYYRGIFDVVINQPSKWTKVASTTLVVWPNGTSGAIVPSYDFIPFSLKANEEISLYVTMRNKLLGYTAKAQDLTGSIAFPSKADGDLIFYTGAGLRQQYEFPDTADTVLCPKFAGIIFYRPNKTIPCSLGTNVEATTSVDYSVYIDIAISQDILSKVSSMVDTAVNKALQTDQSLKALQSKERLRKNSEASSQAGAGGGICPTTFKVCSEVIASVQFMHSPNLDSGEIQYEMYKLASNVTQSIQGALSSQVVYTGYRSIIAMFNLTFNGTPSDTALTFAQRAFLAGNMKSFLSNQMSGSKILRVKITDSLSNTSSSSVGGIRLSRSLLSGSVINGQIYSAESASVSGGSFAFRASNVLNTGASDFVHDLKMNTLLPESFINATDGQFFLYISTISTSMTSLVVGGSDVPLPTQAPTRDIVGDLRNQISDTSPRIWIYFVTAAGALIVIGLVLWQCDRYRQRKRMLRNAKRKSKKLRPKSKRPSSTTHGLNDNRLQAESSRRMSSKRSPSSSTRNLRAETGRQPPVRSKSATNRDRSGPDQSQFIRRQPPRPSKSNESKDMISSDRRSVRSIKSSDEASGHVTQTRPISRRPSSNAELASRLTNGQNPSKSAISSDTSVHTEKDVSNSTTSDQVTIRTESMENGAVESSDENPRPSSMPRDDNVPIRQQERSMAHGEPQDTDLESAQKSLPPPLLDAETIKAITVPAPPRRIDPSAFKSFSASSRALVVDSEDVEKEPPRQLSRSGSIRQSSTRSPSTSTRSLSASSPNRSLAASTRSLSVSTRSLSVVSLHDDVEGRRSLTTTKNDRTTTAATTTMKTNAAVKRPSQRLGQPSNGSGRGDGFLVGGYKVVTEPPKRRVSSIKQTTRSTDV